MSKVIDPDLLDEPEHDADEHEDLCDICRTPINDDGCACGKYDPTEPSHNCESCYDANGGCDDCNVELDYTEQAEQAMSDEIDRRSGNKPRAKPKKINLSAFLNDVEDDIMKLKPRSKGEQLEELYTKDILPLAKYRTNIISATGGSKKSFVALRLMLRLAVQNVSSFAIFSEESSQQIRDRIEFLKGIEPKFTDKHSKYLIMKTLDHTLPSNSDLLVQLIEQAGISEIGLVVIDPLISVIDEDENDNVKAKKFMDKVNKACFDAKVTLLFLHHSAKNTANSRGAGAFTDACRVSYFLEPIEDNDREVQATIHKENIGIRYLLKKEIFNIDMQINSLKKKGNDDFGSDL